MTEQVLNFRNKRALIFHPADGNRDILVEQLGRLGLETKVIWPPSDNIGEEADVIFFDVDRRLAEPAGTFLKTRGLPLIALVGSESPGRLEAMIEQQPSAMLQKPLRSAGIFRALVFAFHAHKQRRDLEERLAYREEQVKARSLVIRAVILVMEQFRIDDSEAFSVLRRAAMARQLPVEAFCFMVLDDPERSRKDIETALRKHRAKDSSGVATASR